MSKYNLIIAEVSIRQDANGRFCINDLHRAAGGLDRHKPANWLRLDSTQDLVNAIEQSPDRDGQYEIGIAQNRAIFTKQGLGTYICKDLVYDYAAWISAEFRLQVYRAYDALMTGKIAKPKRIPRRELELELALERANGRIMQLEHEREIEKLKQELATRPTKVVHVQAADDPFQSIGYERR